MRSPEGAAVAGCSTASPLAPGPPGPPAARAWFSRLAELAPVRPRSRRPRVPSRLTRVTRARPRWPSSSASPSQARRSPGGRGAGLRRRARRSRGAHEEVRADALGERAVEPPRQVERRPPPARRRSGRARPGTAWSGCRASRSSSVGRARRSGSRRRGPSRCSRRPAPSFSRRRLTWVSTVRVVTSALDAPDVVEQRRRGSARGCAARRSVTSSLNSRAVSSTSGSVDPDAVRAPVDPEARRTRGGRSAGARGPGPRRRIAWMRSSSSRTLKGLTT